MEQNNIFLFKKTLTDLAKETGIPPVTLRKRLEYHGFNMAEGEDYKKLGERMPILLSPRGIKKITIKETLQAIVKGKLKNPIEILVDLLKEDIITKEDIVKLPIPPKMRGLVLEEIKKSI